MILFLNFAPIAFMGGAEKWMLDIASKASEIEETILMDVSPAIANFYGRLVLKRSFESHLHKNGQSNNTRKLKRITLNGKHFIPFSKENKETKKIFQRARIIYIKSEVLEILISMYFGGRDMQKKTVAGVQSPLLYGEPISQFDRLHNTVYQSSLFKEYLQGVKQIHVLNARDKKLLQNNFHISKVEQIPDGIHINAKKSEKGKQKNSDKLHIIFVGVLSLRKGIDTLEEIITHAPDTFVFHIIGDGPMKSEIERLSDNKKCMYYGYLDDKTLQQIYNQSDVIVFPSRSETLGLVLLEAMSFGLQTVVSKEVSLDLPKYIEHVALIRDPNEYIKILQKILQDKKNKKIDRNMIKDYAKNNFSTHVIYPKFLEEVLEIRI